jgi:uncharacterized protein YyaL (SSP411 family)
MADFTLQRMAAGGMYDHVGGGYARYGVDAKWLVPHFEKMLYDNALLARAYLHAWQATDDPEHRRIPRGIRPRTRCAVRTSAHSALVEQPRRGRRKDVNIVQ